MKKPIPVDEPFPALSCYGKPLLSKTRRFNLAFSHAQRVAKVPGTKALTSLEKLSGIFGISAQDDGRPQFTELSQNLDPAREKNAAANGSGVSGSVRPGLGKKTADIITEEQPSRYEESGTKEPLGKEGIAKAASVSGATNQAAKRAVKKRAASFCKDKKEQTKQSKGHDPPWKPQKASDSLATSTPLRSQAVDFLKGVSLSPYEFSIDRGVAFAPHGGAGEDYRVGNSWVEAHGAEKAGGVGGMRENSEGASPEAVLVVSPEAVPDVPSETVPDVPSETVPDVPSETVPDVPSETVPDVPSETVPDVPSEVALFVPPEVTPVVPPEGLLGVTTSHTIPSPSTTPRAKFYRAYVSTQLRRKSRTGKSSKQKRPKKIPRAHQSQHPITAARSPPLKSPIVMTNQKNALTPERQGYDSDVPLTKLKRGPNQDQRRNKGHEHLMESMRVSGCEQIELVPKRNETGARKFGETKQNKHVPKMIKSVPKKIAIEPKGIEKEQEKDEREPEDERAPEDERPEDERPEDERKPKIQKKPKRTQGEPKKIKKAPRKRRPRKPKLHYTYRQLLETCPPGEDLLDVIRWKKRDMSRERGQRPNSTTNASRTTCT